MMVNRLVRVLGIVSLLALAGCQEKLALIKVNADGSGVLVLRVCVNPQAGQGMGAPMAMMGGAEPEPMDPKMPRRIVEAIAANCGGITFEEGFQVTSGKGWPGYGARYSFTDVTKLTIDFSYRLEETGPDGSSSSLSSDSDVPTLAFAFTPGDAARLEISADVGKLGEGQDMPGADDPQAQMMMQMMKPALAGMQSKVMVQVDGDVSETNADFEVGAKGNTFLLADVEIGRVVSDPQALAKLEAMGGEVPSESVSVPGVRIQNPSVPTVIVFR